MSFEVGLDILLRGNRLRCS